MPKKILLMCAVNQRFGEVAALVKLIEALRNHPSFSAFHYQIIIDVAYDEAKLQAFEMRLGIIDKIVAQLYQHHNVSIEIRTNARNIEIKSENIQAILIIAFQKLLARRFMRYFDNSDSLYVPVILFSQYNQYFFDVELAYLLKKKLIGEHLLHYFYLGLNSHLFRSSLREMQDFIAYSSDFVGNPTLKIASQQMLHSMNKLNKPQGIFLCQHLEHIQLQPNLKILLEIDRLTVQKYDFATTYLYDVNSLHDFIRMCYHVSDKNLCFFHVSSATNLKPYDIEAIFDELSGYHDSQLVEQIALPMKHQGIQCKYVISMNGAQRTIYFYHFERIENNDLTALMKESRFIGCTGDQSLSTAYSLQNKIVFYEVNSHKYRLLLHLISLYLHHANYSEGFLKRFVGEYLTEQQVRDAWSCLLPLSFIKTPRFGRSETYKKIYVSAYTEIAITQHNVEGYQILASQKWLNLHNAVQDCLEKYFNASKKLPSWLLDKIPNIT